MRSKWLGVGALAAVALAGCTTSSVASPTSGNSSSTSAPSIGSGYLYQSDNEVTFIQLSQNGNDLTGSLYDDPTSGSPPNEQVSSNSATISGSLKGSGVTLSFDGRATVFGQLGVRTLSIEVPQSDGSLRGLTLHQATVGQYNAALSELQNTVSNTNRTDNAIDQAAELASSDVNSLNSADFSYDFTQLEAGLSDVQTDSGGVESDYQQLQGDQARGFNDLVCSELGYVNEEFGGYLAESVQRYLAPDAQQLQAAINDMRQAEQAAQTEVAAYQAAQAKDPSYQSQYQVGDLNSADSNAQSAIAQAISQGNGIIAQGNSDVAQAAKVVRQANSAVSCPGVTAPAAPSPVASVS